MQHADRDAAACSAGAFLSSIFPENDGLARHILPASPVGIPATHSAAHHIDDCRSSDRQRGRRGRERTRGGHRIRHRATAGIDDQRRG